LSKCLAGAEIAVVIPALNEYDGVGLTIGEALRSLPSSRVVVIDGRSRDGTAEVATKWGAAVLSQNGRGKGSALREGLEYLSEISPGPSWLMFCDADYSYPLGSSPTMLELLAGDPSVGMVVGDRFSRFGLWNYFGDRYLFGNLVLRWMHRLLNGVRLEDPLSGLRVLRYEAVKGLELESEGFDIEAELNCHLLARGWRILEVPIARRKRIGRKKLKVKDGFTILRRMLKHRFGRGV